MDDPYGAPGGPVLPPSKFGAGFTVGDGVTQPPPVRGQPAPEPPPAWPHYPPPQYPVATMPVGYAPAQGTNSMAVAALVCSLLFSPLGIVFGHIALSQINRTGEEGRGLAIAGLIIGYIFTAIAVLWVVAGLVFLGWLEATINETTYYDSDYTYSMAAPA